jgi:hypothetical protein
VDRVEDELIAPVCISVNLLAQPISKYQAHSLLPAIEFVENRQRYTLFEATTVVTSKADNVTSDLQAKCDIEVLRHVALRPKADVTFFIRRVSNRLDGFPSQEGIVTDERSDLTTANRKPDCSVHEVGEVGDAVLEVVPRYLHDAGGVLDDSDFR